ncbi:hypothetical protein [Lysinibacillus pakistanensis]|uniref:Uncharacterized protein n=1 Tax=Lysinibacillus pakistanensis TaxID=759811 RepID=A0AAX3X5A2_9BACI|nr:hypothetical protein [Lysinibacillus pakistanensis]MDM5233434.1 hypothetical protein [Lysinibacillus pakistanensis]WHY48906.1 hypothetical protein QNH22_11990 [Lysinibacillus pakistanensis]WHY53917.1 hypothetical protein QNH24_11970 [Lysinibacillus pakistanensis]
MTTITTGDGGIEIQAWNGIDIVSNFTRFQGGTVDFSGVSVTGLNISDGISFFQSSNNPKVLVVRKNGSDIGYLSMN